MFNDVKPCLLDPGTYSSANWALMPLQVIGLLLGLPRDQQRELRERVEASLRTNDGEAINDWDFTFGLADYVRWRMQHPGDDIVSHLATQLSETELINYVAIIAVAGNETTTKLIGWAGYTLARHPDQREELAHDPGLIPGAIEELLRYEPPVRAQARYVMRDVEHHGQIVPRGSAMLLLTAAANRDPRVFDHPDRFDIHRTIDRHHIAFGHGIHFCLGAALARLEGRIALEEILKRYPEWELDEPHLELATPAPSGAGIGFRCSSSRRRREPSACRRPGCPGSSA